MFFDDNEIKLEVNKKISEKCPNIWKQNITLLNNIKEDINGKLESTLN